VLLFVYVLFDLSEYSFDLVHLVLHAARSNIIGIPAVAASNLLTSSHHSVCVVRRGYVVKVIIVAQALIQGSLVSGQVLSLSGGPQRGGAPSSITLVVVILVVG
jgi:hypothetical protein